MPWKLENQDKTIVKYFIPSTTLIFGRGLGSTDIILNDTSISRKHATLTWEKDVDYLKVIDHSRFGTFINKTALNNREGKIKNGDVITLGVQPGVDLICTYVEFDIVSSTMLKDDMTLLIHYLSTIRGNLLKDWNDKVQFLVMSHLKVTFKVACGLIRQVKIVNIDFVKAMVDYYQGIVKIMPDPDDYLPIIHISERSFSTEHFKSNLNRKSLFKQKTFYFLTKEKFVQYNEAIISGGGVAKMLTDVDCSDRSLRIKLAHCDSIVLQDSVKTDLSTKISSILKDVRKRLITDSEIGCAVMFASLDKYCNPFKSIITDNLENVEPKSFPSPPVNELSGKRNKRIYNDSLNVVHGHNENAIDLDKEPISKPLDHGLDNGNVITITDTDSESETEFERNKENSFLKPNLQSWEIFNKPKNSFSEMKTKIVLNDQFNDDFDNISIPGIEKLPVKLANTSIHEPVRTTLNNFQKETQNANNLPSKKQKLNNTIENPKSALKIQMRKSITDKQLFDQNQISLVPTKIQINPANEMDITMCRENVKFAKLIKNNFPDSRNFKIFRKISSIYFESDPVPLVPFR